MDFTAFLGFLGFASLCLLAASSGAIFRPGDWYAGLAKPRWRPPNWLFGPVWMVLYCMIAVSGWLIWRKVGFVAGAVPLGIYLFQLVLNAMWSAICFGMRRLDLALFQMMALWLSIAATIAAFYPIDRMAAYLLLPYIAWVSVAMLLNYSIWRLNRASLAVPH